MILFDLEPFRGKRVCVALSGGVDSVCLLHQFYENAAAYSIVLSALSCEHGIRGERSLSDLQFVKNLCKNWNVPLFEFRRDVPAYAAQHKLGLEEAGRVFRRECFQKILQEGQADIVATAHHKDDYAETVLFRLCRGTSLAGLKVFSEEFARPLQDVSRMQIEAYAAQHNLPFVTDETNSDTAYTRNALRHEVLPLLEKIIPGARDNLVAFARSASADDDYLQSLARAALQKKTDGETAISATLPDPVFYRAVVLALKELGVTRDYTAALLGEVASLKNLQSGKRICLPQNAAAIREHDNIVFYRSTVSREEIPFLCGTVEFNGYSLTVGEGVINEGLRFDFEKLPKDCTLRTRREGDVFTPFAGAKKTLKKFLTDKKIPARIGRTLPLLAVGNEVLAVCGVEISDKIKITEETKRQGFIVCLELKK